MQLTAAPSFRDLGGTRIGAHGQLRGCCVYRAGHLLEPSAVEMDFVRALGLRRIFDLRSAFERAQQPNNWPLAEEVRAAEMAAADTPGRADAAEASRDVIVHLDVNADVRSGREAWFEMLAANDAAGARRIMLATYRNFPRAFASGLSQMFQALLQAPSQPVMVHCTAGKDRTGFFCALLLAALGATEEQIYADYLRLGDRLQHTPLADGLREALSAVLGRPLSAAALTTLLSVEVDFLDAAFDSLRHEFGSIDAYLAAHAGLSAARRASLRDVLLLTA